MGWRPCSGWWKRLLLLLVAIDLLGVLGGRDLRHGILQGVIIDDGIIAVTTEAKKQRDADGARASPKS